MKKLLSIIVSIFFLNISAQNNKSMKETLQPYHFPTQFLKLDEGEIAYVKEGKGKKNGKKLQEMMDFLHVENTLAKEIGIQM